MGINHQEEISLFYLSSKTVACVTGLVWRANHNSVTDQWDVVVAVIIPSLRSPHHKAAGLRVRRRRRRRSAAGSGWVTSGHFWRTSKLLRLFLRACWSLDKFARLCGSLRTHRRSEASGPEHDRLRAALLHELLPPLWRLGRSKPPTETWQQARGNAVFTQRRGVTEVHMKLDHFDIHSSWKWQVVPFWWSGQRCCSAACSSWPSVSVSGLPATAAGWSAGKPSSNAMESRSAITRMTSTSTPALLSSPGSARSAPATASPPWSSSTSPTAVRLWRTATAPWTRCAGAPSKPSSRACPGPAPWAAPRPGGSARRTRPAAPPWGTIYFTAGNFSEGRGARTAAAGWSPTCAPYPRRSSWTHACATARSGTSAST